VPGFLDDLRAALKDGSFRPLPVRERMIPKPVLEPVFEADFEPDNHGALGLDPAVIKLDTLRVDIAVELENRGKRATPAVGGDVISVGDEVGCSLYDAERATLTARYGHLVLAFTPAWLSASGQHEASWAGGAAGAGTEHELLALVRAAMGDCGGEGHL
jgi:hypothetical protein